MKRFAQAFLCLLTAVILFAGCTHPMGKTLDCGDILLTVPGDFLDLSGESYARDADFLYGRKTLICMGLSEKKASLKEMTLDEYTAYVISGNKLSCAPEVSGSGYRFSYEAKIENTTYTYTIATFEGKENFWIFQFYCPSADLTESQPEIDRILESIREK